MPEIELSLSKLNMNDGPLLGQLNEIKSVSPSWQRFLFALQQSVEVARQIAEVCSLPVRIILDESDLIFASLTPLQKLQSEQFPLP